MSGVGQKDVDINDAEIANHLHRIVRPQQEAHSACVPGKRPASQCAILFPSKQRFWSSTVWSAAKKAPILSPCCPDQRLIARSRRRVVDKCEPNGLQCRTTCSVTRRVTFGLLVRPEKTRKPRFQSNPSPPTSPPVGCTILPVPATERSRKKIGEWAPLPRNHPQMSLKTKSEPPLADDNNPSSRGHPPIRSTRSPVSPEESTTQARPAVVECRAGASAKKSNRNMEQAARDRGTEVRHVLQKPTLHPEAADTHQEKERRPH